MRKKVNPADYPELEQVITLAEAERRYGVLRQQLSQAIDDGKIAAVRCGRNVLIARRSLDRYLFPLRQ